LLAGQLAANEPFLLFSATITGFLYFIEHASFLQESYEYTQKSNKQAIQHIEIQKDSACSLTLLIFYVTS
jgi:hypothetical protein